MVLRISRTIVTIRRILPRYHKNARRGILQRQSSLQSAPVPLSASTLNLNPIPGSVQPNKATNLYGQAPGRVIGCTLILRSTEIHLRGTRFSTWCTTIQKSEYPSPRLSLIRDGACVFPEIEIPDPRTKSLIHRHCRGRSAQSSPLPKPQSSRRRVFDFTIPTTYCSIDFPWFRHARNGAHLALRQSR